MNTDYKPFLIQKSKPNSHVRDSLEWGILAKSIPFKVYGKAKDLAKRDWVEFDGEDEFIPDKLSLASYEMDCEFLFRGEHGTANENIHNFLDYLSIGGDFSIYDTYTKVGKKNVRYLDVKDTVLYRRDTSNDIVVFKVTLKVNSPRENIILQK